ncbi:FAD dependent oxidoreductase [Dactylonectria macrodidyma]|uniref:FAD dependent oxidoreductase n=1 Tax=Dactylonectria macrodidyma TaxID=307937 RepID=A0A9P9IRX2_9HYPO|nr:FAD dependent oxidoreductase [Dactylonectria macrodidyma]
MYPSLPVPGSTLSHWHRTTRSFPHLNANLFAEVPASTKYLIIGSGISGALTAWELINHGVEGKDVLILEAREAVSGATGRNAGHVRPDAFRGFPHFSSIHGPEQAKLIIENEKLVLQNVKDFVESQKVDCDFNYTTTFEVCFDKAHADHLAKSLAEFRDAGGDISHIKFYEDEQAKSRTRVPGAVCAYEWPAASNHPGKLCQWVLNDFIQKGGKLWTHCPATEISKLQGSGSMRWETQTPRGIIASETIIHCTNAYAAFLLPELSGIITPRRAQGHSYIPPASLSGHNTLKSTMSLRYGHKHYFSVNQLKDGTVILGGQATRSDADWTPNFFKDRVSFDDTKHNAQIRESSIAEFSKLASISPSTSPNRPGEGFSHVWTGIVGETPDAVPFIGPIDGLDGQWICAGFNGHGMARIFQCAPGLVKLITGSSWTETRLPECFQFSKERLDRVSRLNSKV